METPQAKRAGKIVFLPLFVNAEMLMLEFFKDVNVGLMPLGPVPLGKPGDGDTHFKISVDAPDAALDRLISYINGNI